MRALPTVLAALLLAALPPPAAADAADASADAARAWVRDEAYLARAHVDGCAAWAARPASGGDEATVAGVVLHCLQRVAMHGERVADATADAPLPDLHGNALSLVDRARRCDETTRGANLATEAGRADARNCLGVVAREAGALAAAARLPARAAATPEERLHAAVDLYDDAEAAARAAARAAWHERYAAARGAYEAGVATERARWDYGVEMAAYECRNVYNGTANSECRVATLAPLREEVAARLAALRADAAAGLVDAADGARSTYAAAHALNVAAFLGARADAAADVRALADATPLDPRPRVAAPDDAAWARVAPAGAAPPPAAAAPPAPPPGPGAPDFATDPFAGASADGLLPAPDRAEFAAASRGGALGAGTPGPGVAAALLAAGAAALIAARRR